MSKLKTSRRAPDRINNNIDNKRAGSSINKERKNNFIEIQREIS